MVNLNDWWLECKNCGKDVRVKDFEESGQYDLVCPNCGQAHNIRLHSV